MASEQERKHARVPIVGQPILFKQNDRTFDALITRVWTPLCVNLFVPFVSGSEDPTSGAINSATREAYSVCRDSNGREWSWDFLPCKPGEDHMVEANGLVNGDRQAAYGSPRPAYVAMAKVWTGMIAHKLSEDLTAEDVVLLLAAMKLRRECLKHKRDNIVDLHGYALVLAHTREDGGN